MQGTGGGDFGSPVPSPFMVKWKRRGMEILESFRFEFTANL